MNTDPSQVPNKSPKPWQGFLGAAIVTIASVVTVLGAVLLSLQDDRSAEWPTPSAVPIGELPTAPIVTLPGITETPLSPVEQATSTLPPPSAESDVTATPTEPTVTPTSLPTTVVATPWVPKPTPWPCAGSAPAHWAEYVVQRGDTLYSLAKNRGITKENIIFYNCLTSERIWVGQSLDLPPLLTPTAVPLPTIASPTPTLTGTATHTPPSPTWSPTVAPSPSATATSTFTPNITLEPTGTPTPTETTRPTLTPSPTPSPTPTATPADTATPTETPIPTPTDTPVS